MYLFYFPSTIYFYMPHIRLVVSTRRTNRFVYMLYLLVAIWGRNPSKLLLIALLVLTISFQGVLLALSILIDFIDELRNI